MDVYVVDTHVNDLTRLILLYSANIIIICTYFLYLNNVYTSFTSSTHASLHSSSAYTQIRRSLPSSLRRPVSSRWRDSSGFLALLTWSPVMYGWCGICPTLLVNICCLLCRIQSRGTGFASSYAAIPPRRQVPNHSPPQPVMSLCEWPYDN